MLQKNSHLRVQQLLPIRFQEVSDPGSGTFQHGAPYEQNEENDVGKGGGEIHHFPARRNPLEQDEKYNDPRQDQTNHECRTDRSAVRNTVRYLEHVPRPVLFAGRRGYFSADDSVQLLLRGVHNGADGRGRVEKRAVQRAVYLRSILYTVLSVPYVSTELPRYLALHAAIQVVENPSDDDVVVHRA